MISPAQRSLRIGIDIGGTFTDFVVFDPQNGQITTFKLPSTPANPALAVIAGLAQLKAGLPDLAQSKLQIIHGSTVATNALLERKGARTALVTTDGFRDVLQIGRQNRPSLYDLSVQLPPPLIATDARYEIRERIDASGRPLIALDPAVLPKLTERLLAQAVESVAIVFLFSFVNPIHEQMVAEQIRQAGLFVSVSSEILPEYREYERTSTTAVNAYVTPVLDRYLADLEQHMGPESALPLANLQIMQSNGGCISVAAARQAGVRCILSGPAGGVVGSTFIGQLNHDGTQTGLRLLTFDMGGTSTDVALIEGQPQITNEAEVGGYPIRVPLLDIHTIGAGGGSIATMDAGGVLRVGPQSAGADPGPACYGKGLQATVTDANLVLGRIQAEHFLGGEMSLNLPRAQAVIAQLGAQLGLDPIQTALGIIEVANAHMERALRVISVERGHDPRHFTLFSFGGAGGLHAADLARRMQIPQVLISPYAATLSAFGMLTAHVVKDYTRTVMLPGETPYAHLEQAFATLLARAALEIQAEGFAPEQSQLEQTLDMRYRGQSYELSLPLGLDFAADFHRLHQQTYGYAHPRSALEIVNIRLRATGLVQIPRLQPAPEAGPSPAQAWIGTYPVSLSHAGHAIPFYRGADLLPGNLIPGPAIIVRPDTTILIEAPDQARVDGYGNIVIRVSPGS